MKIEVRNLKYTYSPDMPGATTALDGVSFSVDEPCIIGIIGHTGSGKSTLLQHLNGLIKPTSGEIYIDGELKGNGIWKGSIFAGVHKIEARQRNFESSSQTISIAEKDNRTFVIP
jgi:ABC-type multidrug transport system ATPase subunit